jgi:hypothetical protein
MTIFMCRIVINVCCIATKIFSLTVTFEVREEAVGIGQPDSIAKYGIGESIGQEGDVVEDDYGIAVKPESFVDIVTGIDPSKYKSGTGRIGDDVLKRGLGFGSDGRPLLASSNKLSLTGGREVRKNILIISCFLQNKFIGSK